MNLDKMEHIILHIHRETYRMGMNMPQGKMWEATAVSITVQKSFL